jgi:hypothetical protein
MNYKHFALSFALTLLTSSAFAATLNCWKTDFHPQKPFMTATILPDSRLADIQFNYKDFNGVLTNTNAAVKGEDITSNHSPYRGNVEYDLAGGLTLILPQDLSNKNLIAIEKKGLGYYKNENGVVIGSTEDGEGGGHLSWRLSCRSTK